jgi:SNF2 family DNA or RNA helicase
VRYKFKTTPYAHQVEAIKKLVSNGFGGALLMDPRTGKTKTTIDYLSILAQAGKVDCVLIVCPSRVMDVWVEEFHTHCSLMANVLVWDSKTRRKGFLPPVSAAFDLTVVIVNYEAFGTPGKRLASGRRSKASGRFKHRTLIKKWVGKHNAAIVLDEAHKIKSPSGRASNMVVSMAGDFRYKVILTGTPVTKAKRIHDLYMQWSFLNPARLEELDIRTAAEMKEFTGVWISCNGFPQWLRPKEKNVEKLRAAIHKDAYAVKRSECFDLPPRDVEIIKVPLSRVSAKAYDDLATKMVAEVQEWRELNEEKKELQREKASKPKLEKLEREIHTVEASIALVQRLRLAQVTSGIATTDDDKLIRIGREKLDTLADLLEDIFEKEEKVVIAARFKADLNSITRLVRSMKVPAFELRGGMKREDTTANIRRFKTYDGPAAFIMQPQAGSLGIDLSSASRMIWYSLTPSWVDYTQSCDRIALSRNSTTFTYLLAEGTVDEVQYEELEQDGSVARMITDNPEVFLRNRPVRTR